MERSSDRLYTLSEAAERLAISLRTLRRRIDLGLVQCVRLGPRIVRISERELQRVIRDGVPGVEF